MKAMETKNKFNLKSLNLCDCKLTDEHIESLQPCIQYLEDLDISRNSKMSPQAIKYISDSVMSEIKINNTCSLKSLALNHCALTDEHIESLQPCIPYLEVLDISYFSRMSSQALRYISDSVMKAMETNNKFNLKALKLCDCNLTDEHIESLQPCIQYLEDLDISRNSKMSPQAIKYISDSVMSEIKINNTCSLKSLSLNLCALTDEHIESLQPCIPYLEVLDISYISRMSSQALRYISDSVMKAMETNNTCNLKSLNLSYCNLTDERIESLQPCIPYLEVLDISYNSRMSSQAMKSISDSVMKAIEKNNTCNLKLIILRNCDLSDEGIKCLHPCIPYLQNLDISRNWTMSSQAMMYVSDSIINEIAINNTWNLKLINLHKCYLTDEHIERLQPCIPYLENLDISYNYISDKKKKLIDNLLSIKLK